VEPERRIVKYRKIILRGRLPSLRTFFRSTEEAGRNFWSRAGIPTCRAHRASKTENRRLTTITSENFVVAAAAVPSSFSFPSGAFSPAYKREYTAVPLRPAAALCMYATCIHGSLARSLATGQKRSLHPCVSRHRLARVGRGGAPALAVQRGW